MEAFQLIILALMSEQRDLVEIVEELRPMAVVKG